MLSCAVVALASTGAHAQSDGLVTGEDESMLVPIRLAARGGDYELARQRLAKLTKPYLLAKGTGALATEYARAGDFEKAQQLYDDAVEQVTVADVRGSDRASTYLYLAALMHDDEDFVEQAIVMLDRASETVGKLAGFELDLALIELARVSFLVNGDQEESEAIIALIQDSKLRNKLLISYDLEKPASEE